jgi:hypothetical protein
MRIKWIVAASVAVVLALGVALALRLRGESAEHQVRGHFDVPGTLDTVTLREAVLREVPLGSPESRLAELAAAERLGADGATVYRPSLRGEPAVIRFDAKPPPGGLVTESWIVAFELDGARRVREVRVRHALTGP